MIDNQTNSTIEKTLWSERGLPCYNDVRIFATDSGAIGMEVRGQVIIAPAWMWHHTGRLFMNTPPVSNWRTKLAYWLLKVKV